MPRSITDILINPNAFFAEAVAEKEDLRIPALIILAGGILGAAYGYLMGGLTAKMMAGAMPGIDTFVSVIAAIGALIGVFVFWLIWTCVVFAVSAAFKGKGGFRQTLQVVGYGYLPQVFGSLLVLVAAIEYLPKVVVPHLTAAAMQDPVLMQKATTALMSDPAMAELTHITTIISIVFLLWSANIWIFGIQHARGISMRDAALSVGIPVVLYIAYLAFKLGAA